MLFGITVLPVSAEELLIAMKPVMSYRPGDLDGDGSISTADARLCLRSAVGLQQLPDGDLQRNAEIDRQKKRGGLSGRRYGMCCGYDCGEVPERAIHSILIWGR